MFIFWSITPGRRCACPGLLSCRPAGTPAGEKGEWRTKTAERGKCHYYVYGVTNLVTEVTELVTGKESLTLLLKKLRRADNPSSGKEQAGQEMKKQQKQCGSCSNSRNLFQFKGSVPSLRILRYLSYA